MSVFYDLSQQVPAFSPPIVHTLVIFGGWGGITGGQPLTPSLDSSISSEKLLAEALQLEPFVGKLFAEGWSADLLTSPSDICSDPVQIVHATGVSLTNAWAFAKSHFHPFGKLIVYGYSAGGLCALDFCRGLDLCHKYYTPSREFTSDEDSVNGRVIVDLLITIDAAAGLASTLVNRVVPSNVSVNHNYYQTSSSLIGSHGDVNFAADPQQTQVYNEDLTQRLNNDGYSAMDRHGVIGLYTNPIAIDLIQQTLGLAT